MAFGFPPFYETGIDFLGDRGSARNAIVYAFKILGWQYRTSDPDHFQAKVPDGAPIWGWSELFSVSLGEGAITIRSSSGFWPIPQFDGGKNQKNVEQFLVHYSQKELRDFKTRNEPSHIDEGGNTPLERLLLGSSENS